MIYYWDIFDMAKQNGHIFEMYPYKERHIDQIAEY